MVKTSGARSVGVCCRQSLCGLRVQKLSFEPNRVRGKIPTQCALHERQGEQRRMREEGTGGNPRLSKAPRFRQGARRFSETPSTTALTRRRRRPRPRPHHRPSFAASWQLRKVMHQRGHPTRVQGMEHFHPT